MAKRSKTPEELEELKAIKGRMRLLRLWVEGTTIRQELRRCIDESTDRWAECAVLKNYLDADDMEHALLAAFWLGMSVGMDEDFAMHRKAIMKEHSRREKQRKAVSDLASRRRKWLLDCYTGLPDADKRRGKMAIARLIARRFNEQKDVDEANGKKWTLGKPPKPDTVRKILALVTNGNH